MEYNKRNAGGVCGAGTQTQQQTQQTRTATIFLPFSSYSHSLSVPSRIGVTGLAGVEMKSDDICFPFFLFLLLFIIVSFLLAVGLAAKTNTRE